MTSGRGVPLSVGSGEVEGGTGLEFGAASGAEGLRALAGVDTTAEDGVTIGIEAAGSRTTGVEAGDAADSCAAAEDGPAAADSALAISRAGAEATVTGAGVCEEAGVLA